MRIVLIGGGGFLGEYLLRALVADRHHCSVLTRDVNRRKKLRLMNGVDLVRADIYDQGVLAECFNGADAVISMAGILNEGGGAGSSFSNVHIDLVKNIISASRKAGVSRLLHVSALNAGKGDSEYLKTKGEAEKLLRNADGLHVSIFQPSVIFGAGDQFFNRFAAMLHLAPVLPLACPKSRLQPVYAGNVVAAMVASLDDPMTWGKTYELAGPKIYTLKELVQWTANAMGKRRLILGLPGPLSALMARVMGLVPGKPLSWDNYLSLKTDSVSKDDGFSYFGIEPRSIEMEVPFYLNGSVHQHRLSAVRRQLPR